MIRRYLGLLAVLTAVRLLARLIAMAAGAALVVAAAPVSLVAAYAVAHAWIAGWPPRRLYRAALWCLPMVAVWAALTASAARSWWQLAAAPYLAWLAMWHLAAAGAVVPAALTIAPVAIPLGLAVGALAWSRRIFAMQTGTGLDQGGWIQPQAGGIGTFGRGFLADHKLFWPTQSYPQSVHALMSDTGAPGFYAAELSRIQAPRKLDPPRLEVVVRFLAGTFIGFMEWWGREENENLPAETVDRAFRSLVLPGIAHVLDLEIEIPSAL